ncbi:MAG TPA: hypothetical protein VHZ56_09335 [Devosia sp.]|jgi:hypothetical protein|nr:hypothetical protein [Devosia sp.]
MWWHADIGPDASARPDPSSAGNRPAEATIPDPAATTPPRPARRPARRDDDWALRDAELQPLRDATMRW